MKNNVVPQSAPAFMPATHSAGGRFQIYRESRAGNYIPTFSSASDTEVIEAFILHAPMYDGGGIWVVDQSEQRMIAFVKWKIARTEIGLPVLQRSNVFQDWQYAMIACDLLLQKKICGALEMQF